jgi:hypothetical protein
MHGNWNRLNSLNETSNATGVLYLRIDLYSSRTGEN